MVPLGSREEDKTQPCLEAVMGGKCSSLWGALDFHLAHQGSWQARGLVCPEWTCLQAIGMWVRLHVWLVKSWEPQEPVHVPVFRLHLSELSSDYRRCEGSK